MKPKILYLTLKPLPFETILKRFKDREYRKSSKWIKSRLIDSKTKQRKEYDYILLRNGYSRKNRYILCKYLGFEISKINYTVSYSTGLTVNVNKGYYRILLGSIIKSGNIEMMDLFLK